VCRAGRSRVARCLHCATNRRRGALRSAKRMKPATKKPHVSLYDTTLRDGCQGEDVSLTLADKLRVAERLDELGFPYIQAVSPAPLRRVVRPSGEEAEAPACTERLVRYDASGRHGGGGRPQPPEVGRSRDPGDHHLRQDLATPRTRGSEDLPRGESRGDPRF